MCSNLASKNNKQFWKSFKSKLGRNTTENFNIGNSTDPNVIASQFAAQFSNACTPQSPDVYNKAETEFERMKTGMHNKKDLLCSILACNINEIKKYSTLSKT